LKKRRPHRDSERLRFRRPRDDATVVVRQDDDRAVLPIGPKNLFARREKAVAVQKSDYFHRRASTFSNVFKFSALSSIFVAPPSAKGVDEFALAASFA
jgi:hypothetical protein